MLQNVIKTWKTPLTSLKIDQNLGWKNLGLEPGFGRGGVAAPTKCYVKSDATEHSPYNKNASTSQSMVESSVYLPFRSDFLTNTFRSVTVDKKYTLIRKCI